VRLAQFPQTEYFILSITNSERIAGVEAVVHGFSLAVIVR
jgi:hypothetical protein